MPAVTVVPLIAFLLLAGAESSFAMSVSSSASKQISVMVFSDLAWPWWWVAVYYLYRMTADIIYVPVALLCHEMNVHTNVVFDSMYIVMSAKRN